jgi:hypothetical protein
MITNEGRLREGGLELNERRSQLTSKEGREDQAMVKIDFGKPADGVACQRRSFLRKKLCERGELTIKEDKVHPTSGGRFGE